MAFRNHIGKILLQIEEKENALVDQAAELGEQRLMKQTRRSLRDTTFLDIMDLKTGDLSYKNLIFVESAVHNGGDNVDLLRSIKT
jgi:hypothetical protein